MLKLLRELNIEEDTIVIMTSDNGYVLNDGYNDQAEELNRKSGHTPGGILRGGKYSRYDGGMHVPFILQWKGTVTPAVSDAVVCQIDFLASFAKLTGGEIPQGTDSLDTLDTLLGRSAEGREELVLEALRKLSFRSGQWYFVPTEKGGELFDLSSDPSQKTDVAKENPERVKAMSERLQEIVK